MSKMFKSVTKTWNPFTGCKFNCIYCWARDLALGRLKNSQRYATGFIPSFHPEELKKKFKPGDFVFVSDMGDITFCPSGNLDDILGVIEDNQRTDFLIQTKGVKLFQRPGIVWPKNVYHGMTIETNRDTTHYSRAPLPFQRYSAMIFDKHPHKFISIEPIMRFMLSEMIAFVKDISPSFVVIGADSKGHNLDEPPTENINSLINELNKLTKVIVKDNLKRLLK